MDFDSDSFTEEELRLMENTPKPERQKSLYERIYEKEKSSW
jgi:hypothetical protein